MTVKRYEHSKPNVEPMSINIYGIIRISHFFFFGCSRSFRKKSEENQCILTIQCGSSKFVEGYSLKNKEATTVAKASVDSFILRYEIPELLVTDRGTGFLSFFIIR